MLRIWKRFKTVEYRKEKLITGISGALLIIISIYTFVPRDVEFRILPAAQEQEIVLYPDQEIHEHRGQFISWEFTSTPGNGKSIRYRYDNRGNTDAAVRFYKRDFFGRWKMVSSVNVAPGNAHCESYATYRADQRVTYHVTIDPATTSSYLNGILRVTQARDTEP